MAGARTLKIAMFDEVNESTAMFKLASRRSEAPDQGYWLTLDADGFTLPSDWYLRLAGEVTRMFHGQRPPSPLLPEDPGPPYAGAPGVTAVNGASLQAGPAAAGAAVTLFGERFRTAPPPPVDSSLTVIDSSGAGRAAIVLYGSPGQVNIVVPEGTAAGPATLAVELDDGSLAYGRLAIQPVAPGIFTAGDGSTPVALVRVEQPDGAVSNTPVVVCEGEGGCRAAPIDLGPPGSLAVLELYGTGIRGRSSIEALTCQVGVEVARVVWAGPDPDRPGVDRVQVAIPRSLAGSGAAAIRLSVDGVDANSVHVTFR
jgi:uncharacterized protein (TIGR03437 family)